MNYVNPSNQRSRGTQHTSDYIKRRSDTANLNLLTSTTIPCLQDTILYYQICYKTMKYSFDQNGAGLCVCLYSLWQVNKYTPAGPAVEENETAK